jgi:radical SAM-linked protein
VLSNKQKVKHPSKFDRPLLGEPVTYRVIFSKKGDLQYFSHLDLQRTWQRVLVRAQIPMWYTQGFNPHSKIVFGVPLPVGSEGLEEMVDLRIAREISCEEMKNQLNAELTGEMQVSAVYVPETSFGDISWGVYEMTLSTPGDAAEIAGRINALLAEGGAPIVMTKRSKSGDKEVDIRPMVHDLRASADCHGLVHIRTTLRAGNVENLNPEYIIKALRRELCILPEDGDPATTFYRILRIGFYDAKGVESGKWFR